jgi:hypothetical protein
MSNFGKIQIKVEYLKELPFDIKNLYNSDINDLLKSNYIISEDPKEEKNISIPIKTTVERRKESFIGILSFIINKALHLLQYQEI